MIHTMRPSEFKRPLDLLPSLTRAISIVLALVIGWLVTAGAGLSAMFVIWWGVAIANDMAVELFAHLARLPLAEGWLANTLNAAARAAPVISVPPGLEQWLVWTGWAALGFSALAFVGLTLSSMRRSIERITGHSGVTKVPVSHPLSEFTERLRTEAGVRFKPSVWVVPATGLVAFAMSAPGGRRAIVLSSSLVERLPEEELLWVMAHELAHLDYGDTNSATIWLASYRGMHLFDRLKVHAFNAVLRLTDRLPGVRALLMLPLMLFFETLITSARIGRWMSRQLFLLPDRWVSRHMEYRADAYAAALVGAKPGVSVLERLGSIEPAFNGLFATHPSPSKRIEALLQRTLQFR